MIGPDPKMSFKNCVGVTVATKNMTFNYLSNFSCLYQLVEGSVLNIGYQILNCNPET